MFRAIFIGLAALCHGQSFVQFVGNEAGKAYTFKCTKDGASAAGFKIEVNECKAKKCPPVSVNEDGRLTVTNFPIDASGSSYKCGENIVTVGLLEKPTPQVTTELGSMELPESSGTGTELAKCESGYAMPSPDVAWLKYDGTVVQTCDISNVDELNTQTCLRDQYEDNELRHTVDLILVQEVKKSESNQYRCRVDYYEAEDGEKVKKSIEIKFPAEGCISAAGSEAECPADEDDSKDAALATFAPVTKNEEHEVPIETTTVVDEAGGSSTNHALLGTATGIVIFAIIVILIWFIRKRNRDSQENAAELQGTQGYSVGQQKTSA